jgi:hypothetical protein
LQGCSRAHVNSAPPAPVAIPVDTHAKAPSELLRCPERPEGFPAGAWAVMPEAVREAAIRLAQAFSANADRQTRLIEWESGKPCLGSSASSPSSPTP